MKPQCDSLSSKVAVAAVMMFLILASFRSHRVEALVPGTSATGIFHGLLIAELHALLCFWHCLLPSSIGLLFVSK
jgi:hypothetical protein